MKLLLDQNLSPKIVRHLKSIFECYHVQDFNMDNADDHFVWNYAKNNNLTIVTKDSDFADMIQLKGFPPKVIWIRKRNCATAEIVGLLLKNETEIKQFENQKNFGIIILK